MKAVFIIIIIILLQPMMDSRFFMVERELYNSQNVISGKVVSKWCKRKLECIRKVEKVYVSHEERMKNLFLNYSI